MKKIIIISCLMFLTVLILNACGMSRETTIQDENKSLYVVSVMPENGAVLGQTESIQIEFSQPLLESSVSQDTLFIMKKSDFDEYQTQDWDDLYDDVQKGDVSVQKTTLQFNATQKAVTLLLDEVFSPSESCVLVALPKIQSVDYYPLDQTTAGSSDKSFTAQFVIKSNASNNNENVNPSEGYPDLSDSNKVNDPTEIIEATFDWQRVLITEVVTDPQQDHSESEQGNDIEFDGIPGTGTIGSTDEYIELYNGSETVLDLTDWTINMSDGTDEIQTLNADTENLFFSLDGSIDEFSPGEFVVVGNPEGAINNTVSIELVDDDGTLIDEVDIDDANASGLEDEAYYRDPEGDWIQGEATPGFFE